MASAADPAHGPTGGKGPGRVEPVPGIPPQADVALLPVENPKLLTLGVMTASALVPDAGGLVPALVREL